MAFAIFSSAQGRIDDHAASHSEIYYRIERGSVVRILPGGSLQVDGTVDFMTYVNGFSALKWRQYAGLDEVCLNLVLGGSGIVRIFGVEHGSPEPVQIKQVPFSPENGSGSLAISVCLEIFDLIGFSVSSEESTTATLDEVDRAALPRGAPEDLAERADEARVGVRDDEPHARRHARADGPQEGEPRVVGLGVNHVDAEDAPPAARIAADGGDHGGGVAAAPAAALDVGRAPGSRCGCSPRPRTAGRPRRPSLHSRPARRACGAGRECRWRRRRNGAWRACPASGLIRFP